MGGDADCIVSGHSPVGGIDIWAEDIAREAGIALDLKAHNAWNPPAGYGFKARNIDIAAELTSSSSSTCCRPATKGCASPAATTAPARQAAPRQMGGCWTGNYALKLGKPAMWWRGPAAARARTPDARAPKAGSPSAPPASLGCADVIAMRSADWLIDSKPVSEVLLIEVKSTAGGPYEHFGPADRARLIAAAKQAGASTAFAWWPKNGNFTWYPSANWPSRGTQLALEA